MKMTSEQLLLSLLQAEIYVLTGRQDKACQHTQQRVLEHQQNIRKFRHIRQWFHRITHGFHTKHQHSKPNHDCSDILFLFIFNKEQKNHTDHCKKR